MARNAEKAQAMLNRFIQGKKDAVKKEAERRPFIASDVTDLQECEKWRGQCIRDIAKQVTAIQNASLGEHKIRDLNDKINKLMREKKHWERQIKLLGGADYTTTAPRVLDSDGQRAMGTDGYYYFGAARDLPGVRELFAHQAANAPKRTRGELYRTVDADYYGYRDDDDGLLVKLEQKAEKKAIEAAVQEWMSSAKRPKTDRDFRSARESQLDDELDEERAREAADAEDFKPSMLRAHVELPSQEEIEKVVLAKKKMDLIAKYGSQS